MRTSSEYKSHKPPPASPLRPYPPPHPPPCLALTLPPLYRFTPSPSRFGAHGLWAAALWATPEVRDSPARRDSRVKEEDRRKWELEADRCQRRVVQHAVKLRSYFHATLRCASLPTMRALLRRRRLIIKLVIKLLTETTFHHPLL